MTEAMEDRGHTRENASDRLFWRKASPFLRLLDAEMAITSDGSGSMWLSPGHRVAFSSQNPRPHPLMLPGLADDCLSLAIDGGLDAAHGILTLDMWLSFADRRPDGSTVRAVATRTGSNGDFATARVEISDDGGPLLLGTGTFLTGRYPSGQSGDRDRAGRFDVSVVSGPFATATGMVLHADGASFSGESRAVIGWEAGPAIHGGATAALLCAASVQVAPPGSELSSVHVRYLRPAIGAFLQAKATVDVAAKRARHVSAVAFSDPTAPVAACSAVFLGRTPD